MQWIKCENGDHLNPNNLLSIAVKEIREGGWRVVGMLAHAEKSYPIATVKTKAEAQAMIEGLVAFLTKKEAIDGTTIGGEKTH